MDAPHVVAGAGMSNITDIRDRLPPPKFKPRIVDHSSVEAFEAAPTEILVGHQRKIIFEAAKQLCRLVGADRATLEVADILSEAEKIVSHE